MKKGDKFTAVPMRGKDVPKKIMSSIQNCQFCAKDDLPKGIESYKPAFTFYYRIGMTHWFAMVIVSSEEGCIEYEMLILGPDLYVCTLIVTSYVFIARYQYIIAHKKRTC